MKEEPTIYYVGKLGKDPAFVNTQAQGNKQKIRDI
jgi:hypothetical protein